MNKLIKVVSPFKTLTASEKRWSTIAVIVIVFLVWTASGSGYIPNPWDVFGAFPGLVEKYGLVDHFIKSLTFCFKAIFYSTAIALFVAYLSRIPLFESFAEFLRKFRFLPSTGLSFFFMKITGDQSGQMLWMMIFGITAWLIDSMVGIALSITKDDVMYARSLRLSRWQSMKELLILGKAADMFNAVISNFAIAWLLLATIENIAKASGGIGVVLAETNKYFHMEEVYCIQIIILFTGIAIDTTLRWLRKFLFPYVDLKH